MKYEWFARWSWADSQQRFSQYTMAALASRYVFTPRTLANSWHYARALSRRYNASHVAVSGRRVFCPYGGRRELARILNALIRRVDPIWIDWKRTKSAYHVPLCNATVRRAVNHIFIPRTRYVVYSIIITVRTRYVVCVCVCVHDGRRCR